ncbi:MAG: T9SS type A sorting domain-containing protein, partial [Saprospiraceae bacterium]|nr:T9SS type A sorting domain-containing protein [Saprospiraceae bacterium]
NLSFEVFPNPTNNIIQLNSQAKGDFNYEIHDQQGRLILSGQMPSNGISLTPLSHGTYILTILDEKTGQHRSEQVIKL